MAPNLALPWQPFVWHLVSGQLTSRWPGEKHGVLKMTIGTVTVAIAEVVTKAVGQGRYRCPSPSYIEFKQI